MKLAHLKRYQEIATLLWRYGRGDLAQAIDAEGAARAPNGAREVGKVTPHQLADDLEGMGPTYVKIGQVLSSRPDLLPEAYLKSLTRLQDNVKPFPYEDVERIVTSELSVRISKAFADFDREPLAAASLGQVHAATLRDGRQVVVKVQRPGIRERIAEDFEVLAELATLVDKHTSVGKKFHFAEVLEEFRHSIQQELNYENEAQNLVTVGRNLAEYRHLLVPQPVPDYCTRSVLTMEHVPGSKITKISKVALLDVPGAVLVEELFQAYLKQVLIDGLFHADPHPGNIFLTPDNRIALLDLGMVGHTAPGMQETLFKLLLAVSEGRGEDAADLAIHVGEKSDEFDPMEFRRKISQMVAQRRDQGLEQIKVGQGLLDVTTHARDNGLYVPTELALLAKTLLQLDEIGRILDADFDPNASIRASVTKLMARRMKQDLTRNNAMNSLLELKDFTAQLPGRVNRVLDAVANDEVELKVKAVDAKVMLDGMQKIANRIAMALVLAALIVGAALMMRIETAFTLFGYPGLAIGCFLAAAAGGFYLVISIFVTDRKSKAKCE